MTEEEAYKKYGDINLTFDYYYKYSFNYTGRGPDGEVIHASIGGDSGDIYKLNVSNNEMKPVGFPSEEWTTLSIRTGDKENKQIFNHSDY